MSAQQRASVSTDEDLPPAALLSNGRYTVYVDGDGRGHATYDGRLLTPRLGLGTCLYVSDAEGEVPWSLGLQPIPAGRQAYEAAGGPGAFQIRRTQNGLRAAMDLCVVPESDAEMRRFTITNVSDRPRDVRLTLVTEAATVRAGAFDPAGPQGSGISSPIALKHVADPPGVLVRWDGPGEEPLFWLHSLVGGDLRPKDYETDGRRFFGAERDLEHPAGLAAGLRGVVDAEQPIVAMQMRSTLHPGAPQAFVLACCAGSSAEQVVRIARSLADRGRRADAFLEAALREQQLRDRLKLGPKNADRYHRVAAAIIRGEAFLRAGPDASEEDGRAAARRLGLDPDRPLVVCRVADESELRLARLTLKARAFWHALGLDVQLLVLNDKSGPQADRLQRDLHDLLEHAESAGQEAVLRHADAVLPEDQRAVQRIARLVLNSDREELLHVRA